MGDRRTTFQAGWPELRSHKARHSESKQNEIDRAVYEIELKLIKDAYILFLAMGEGGGQLRTLIVAATRKIAALQATSEPDPAEWEPDAKGNYEIEEVRKIQQEE